MKTWRILLAPGLRGLPILVGMVLVFVVIVLLLVRSYRRQDYQARAAALLDRIEYVQELELTTFYFEEVVTIGTRDRVAKRADHAQKELEAAEALLIRTELEVARARAAHETALAAFYAEDTLLAGPRARLAAAREHFGRIDKLFFGAILQALEANPDTFGGAVRTAYQTWASQVAAFKASPVGRARRDARRAREAAEEVLRTAVEKEKDLRRRQRDRWLEAYHRELDLHQEVRDQLTLARDAALDQFERMQRAYAKAAEEVLAREETLEKAREELAAAEAAGEALEPKLVIVVPVSVSGFVNLQNLAFQPMDGELGGDTLLVVLPQPQVDSVQVRLEATENYDLASRVGFSVSEDGFYFEIFQQLQDALAELKVQVREKALARGIEAETRRLAEAYVTDFAGSLGYQVRFVSVLPAKPPGPAPLRFEEDSL